MESEGYAFLHGENSRTSCPCDYIDHQPKVRETPNLTVTAVKYAVYTKCKCILQQTWVEMRIFHHSKLHKTTPGPGFRVGRLIQAALTVFVIIKVDLKFFSLIYTWVKMSRGSKYHESVGLIKTKPQSSQSRRFARVYSLYRRNTHF